MTFFNRSGNAATLEIYQEIGRGFFGDGLTPADFGMELRALDGVEEITVYINSPGGDVFDGLTIYNQLRSSPAHVTAVVEGLAGSIASVILQAADRRVIAENAFVMIHEPYAVGAGSANELRELANVLDRTRESILGAYLRKAGDGARKALSDAMAVETWYTAETALAAGLVDSVDNALQAAACAVSDDTRRAWRNAPAALRGGTVAAAPGAAMRRGQALGASRERLARISG